MSAVLSLPEERRGMHAAIRNNDLETLQSYLVNNSNPSQDLINLPDHMSRTPLHLAAWLGSTSIVQYLLSMKASYLLKAKDNFLPIHFAIMSSSVDCCELLLKTIPTTQLRNKIVNMKITKSQKTSLHLATSKGNYQIIQLLLDAGADPCALTKDGKSVIDFIKDEKEHETEGKGEGRDGVEEEPKRSYEMIYELLKGAMEKKIQNNLQKIQKRKSEESESYDETSVRGSRGEEGVEEIHKSHVVVGPPESSFGGAEVAPDPAPTIPGSASAGVESTEGSKIIKIDLRKKKKSRIGIHLSHLEDEEETN